MTPKNHQSGSFQIAAGAPVTPSVMPSAKIPDGPLHRIRTLDTVNEVEEQSERISSLHQLNNSIRSGMMATFNNNNQRISSQDGIINMSGNQDNFSFTTAAMNFAQ